MTARLLDAWQSSAALPYLTMATTGGVTIELWAKPGKVTVVAGKRLVECSGHSEAIEIARHLHDELVASP